MKQIGRFLFEKRLAEGGVAKVYLGYDPADEPKEIFVIKVGSAEDHDDFMKEATILKRLRHPNVVRVVDFGTERGKVFIAMEHVHGVDLHTLLRQHPILAINDAAMITREVASALAAAHALKDESGAELHIVHRDVTPTNILLSLKGEVKLADFGTAKWEQAEVRTKTGIIKGKYEYLAPEQALGVGVDHRTDLYCLGLVLYEMLSGKRAYSAADPYDMIELAANGTLVPAKTAMPKEAKAIVPIVERLLAKEPKQRFQTAKAVIEAIDLAVPGAKAGSVRTDVSLLVQASRHARGRKTPTRDD